MATPAFVSVQSLLAVRQFLVSSIEFAVRLARHGVVGIAYVGGIFVGQRGEWVDLAGQVLVLADAGIGRGLVWIIDRADGLEPRLVETLVPEGEAAVGQRAEALIAISRSIGSTIVVARLTSIIDT